MKRCYTLTSLLAFSLLCSFKPNRACEYAGSNLGFVKGQTERAVSENNLNKVRFFAYKALNAIEKSKNDLTACGCEDADQFILEGKENLKKAVHTISLGEAKEFLRTALKNTFDSMEALVNHELHKNKYPDDVLAMNIVDANGVSVSRAIPSEISLHEKIDASLMDYEISLNEIVLSVNCDDARAFASRVFKECEAELLKPNLSEGKKYYNLRTKDITAEALNRIGECN